MSTYLRIEPDNPFEPEFRWHGGEYIECGYAAENGEWRAGDVINVWDYAAGERAIDFSIPAFEDAVGKYLAAQAGDDE